MAVLEELRAQEITKSVIFLVEGEDDCVGSTCMRMSVRTISIVVKHSRVSISSSIFFSPSARINASVLSSEVSKLPTVTHGYQSQAGTKDGLSEGGVSGPRCCNCCCAPVLVVDGIVINSGILITLA